MAKKAFPKKLFVFWEECQNDEAFISAHEDADSCEDGPVVIYVLQSKHTKQTTSKLVPATRNSCSLPTVS